MKCHLKSILVVIIGAFCLGFNQIQSGSQHCVSVDTKLPTITIPNVSTFAKSPTEDIFAIVGQDGRSYLWDTNQQETRFYLNGTQIFGFVWSPDGHLISGGEYLWNADTGAELQRLDAHPVELKDEMFSEYGHRISSRAFSPDGRLLATASTYDKTAFIWNIETGDIIHTLGGHQDGVQNIQFSPDGSTVVTSSSFSNEVILWDIQTGNRIHVLNVTPEVVAFSPDGRLLATGFGRWTSAIELWNTETGEQLHFYEPPLSVSSIKWLSDNQSFIASFTSGILVSEFKYSGAALRVWDISSSDERKTFQLVSEQTIAHQFEPNEFFLGMSVEVDNGALIWNRETGEVYGVNVEAGGTSSDIDVTSDEIISYAINNDETFLATGTNTGKVVIWDFTTGNCLQMFQAYYGGFDKVGISLVTWLSNENLIATLAWDDTVKLWNLSENERQK